MLQLATYLVTFNILCSNAAKRVIWWEGNNDRISNTSRGADSPRRRYVSYTTSPKSLGVQYVLWQGGPSLSPYCVQCIFSPCCDPFALKWTHTTTAINHKGSARKTRPGFWRPGRRRRPIRPWRGARASTSWPPPTTISTTTTTGGGTWLREGFPINTSQGQDMHRSFCTAFHVVFKRFLRSLPKGWKLKAPHFPPETTGNAPVLISSSYPEFKLDTDDTYYENTRENRSRSPGYAIVV